MKLLTQINLLRRGRSTLVEMTAFDEKTLIPLCAHLLVRESDLLGNISAARKADISVTNAVAIATRDVSDFKDQASNQERTTLQDAEAQRDRNELAEVHAALDRLRDGIYGTCIDCGQPIDLLRLTAIPSAARCMACQMQLEPRAFTEIAIPSRQYCGKISSSLFHE